MANTLATPDWTVFEVARYFVNSLRGVGQFNRTYSNEYVQAGAKVGDTVKIRLPQQFTTTAGEALTEQNLYDETVNLVLNRRRHVGFGYSSQEMTTDIDALRARYVQPAAETLASTYDRLALADVYKDVFNKVGTPGTTANDPLTYLQAVVKIIDSAGPDENLCAVLAPLDMATIAEANNTLFHPVRQLTENYTRGQMAADQLGIAKWFQDQNIPRHTTGACTGASTPLVNGAGQTGSSIVSDGWGAGVCSLKEGDVIAIAGVYKVNPLSKESTGQLMQFTLTSDISDTAGAITLPISPSIVTTGARQNVSAGPADDAVITFWSMTAGGTQAATVSSQNLIFHPDAFANANADLVMPNGGAKASRVSSKMLNISLRYVEQFDITDDKNRNRLDFLMGSVAVQPRLACRVVG